MGRQAGKPSVQEISDGRNGPASSGAQHIYPSAPPTTEALIVFAEEFGRIIARQLLADPNRRRGYSLPQGMVGLAFNATMIVLLYCLVAWFRR